MMADDTAPHFQMLAAREAVSRGLSHNSAAGSLPLENGQRGELAPSGLGFDPVEGPWIESTCRTISPNAKSNGGRVKIFRPCSVSGQPAVTATESSNETAARQSLDQALGGLQSTVQGICELRNHYSFASHGYETDRARMEQAQATLVAGAADVIIGFLYGMHAQSRAGNAGATQSLYDENEEFNNSIDDTHEICVIFEAEFWPSAVLFQMEPETYRLRLAEFKTETEESEAVDS